jgi:CelD/BcsL family acetyltransferase involved in cellulose biosynthesis
MAHRAHRSVARMVLRECGTATVRRDGGPAGGADEEAVATVIAETATGLRWLDPSRETDAALWLKLWEVSQARRPHDHPGYLLAMTTPGCTPAAVWYRDPSGASVFYPFYCRPLIEAPFPAGASAPLLHLVSPYGYGGPLYQGAPELKEEVSARFDETFRGELVRRGVVSEFEREDVFADRLALRQHGERLEQQLNVVVRLDRDADEIWQGYHPKVRKNVNRALQSGLRVVFDREGAFLDRFLAVYHDTMTRTGAARSFFISKETFKELGASLGAAGGLCYVHVFDGEEMVSTELLLLSRDTIYSFLGGTSAASFEKRPNDLLKHKVIEWGRAHGFRHYVLGGGFLPGDGIFKYKKAFDPGGVVPFFVRKIEHDPRSCSELLQRRLAHETRLGRSWQPRPNFFPAYLS